MDHNKLKQLEIVRDLALHALHHVVWLNFELRTHFREVSKQNPENESEHRERIKTILLDFDSTKDRLAKSLTYDIRQALADANGHLTAPITHNSRSASSYTELSLAMLVQQSIVMDVEPMFAEILEGESEEQAYARVVSGLLSKGNGIEPDQWGAAIRLEYTRAAALIAQVKSEIANIDWQAQAAALLRDNPNLTNRQIGDAVSKSHTAVGNSKMVRDIRKMLVGSPQRQPSRKAVGDDE